MAMMVPSRPTHDSKLGQDMQTRNTCMLPDTMVAGKSQFQRIIT